MAQGHYVFLTNNIHHFGFAFTKNIFLPRLVTTVHRIHVARFFFLFQEINYFKDSSHQNSTITENLQHLICFTGGAFKLFHIQNGPKSELAIESTQQEKRETEPQQGYCSLSCMVGRRTVERKVSWFRDIQKNRHSCGMDDQWRSSVK